MKKPTKRWRVHWIYEYYGGAGNHCNGAHQESRDVRSKEAAKEIAKMQDGTIEDLWDTVRCEHCDNEVRRNQTITDCFCNGVRKTVCQDCYGHYMGNGWLPVAEKEMDKARTTDIERQPKQGEE